MTPSILEFLSRNWFSVELSFDALAQDVHRKRGSSPALLDALDGILARPRIRLEVNSVFTPRSVALLAESVKFLAGIGVANIRISPALNRPWTRAALEELKSQLGRVRRMMARSVRRGEQVQVVNFRAEAAPGGRIFGCGAGRDRMAVSPEGDIWGCHLFPDLFRIRGSESDIGAFRFGRLADRQAFDEHHAMVLGRHAGLSQDSFMVAGKSCLFCPDLESCGVCPLHAVYAGGRMTEIPSHACAIQRLWISERRSLERSLSR
jgi:radical SAM protein with 4Fe4S-binding SPASM domain